MQVITMVQRLCDIAARKGHAEVVKLLLEGNKADVNASDYDGVTPLYIAARKGYTEVVKLLLDNKADVNASRHTDVTSPHAAVDVGYTEVMKLPQATQTDGDKPIDAARRNHHVDIVKLLQWFADSEISPFVL